MVKGTYKLQLLGNALDFLNSSLRYVLRSRTENNPLLWRFALLHLTQALELILKERLRRENQVLLYANLDRYVSDQRRRSTVTWQTAVERLKYVLGESMTEIDSGRLALAYELRNDIVHYEAKLEFPEAYDHYSNVLDFLAKFYERFLMPYLNSPLKEKIDPDLLDELQLADFRFETDIVYHNDIFMSKLDREVLQREQGRRHLTVDGVQYARIPYGQEHQFEQMELWYEATYADRPCHDCLTKKGDLHALGCDVERCPRCHGQLLGCGCPYDEEPFDFGD